MGLGLQAISLRMMWAMVGHKVPPVTVMMIQTAVHKVLSLLPLDVPCLRETLPSHGLFTTQQLHAWKEGAH